MKFLVLLLTTLLTTGFANAGDYYGGGSGAMQQQYLSPMEIFNKTKELRDQAVRESRGDSRYRDPTVGAESCNDIPEYCNKYSGSGYRRY